ncbi:MAG TPA: SRPBCC family protein [Polyangiaceae bacterium]
MSHVEPVKKQIIVTATAERAFAVFTAGIDRWWPREHHIGKSPLRRAVLEQRPEGRWYSLCEDGSECEVGKVLSWEPPHRLLLAWQITADWQYDPKFVTEVLVTFTTLGPNQTRVVLEHRDLERFGEKAEALRKSLDSAGGWGKIMDELAKAIEAIDAG